MTEPSVSISIDFPFSSDSEYSTSPRKLSQDRRKRIRSSHTSWPCTPRNKSLKGSGSDSSNISPTGRHVKSLNFKRSPSNFSGLPSPDLLDHGSASSSGIRAHDQDIGVALPTPPDSEHDGLSSPLINTAPQNSQDRFPFPLQPTHLPSMGETEAPQTPSRRHRSPQRLRCRASPSPDRFISDRSIPTTSQSPAETYRVSRLPQQLLPNERLLRHRSATPDPFGPLRVARVRDERSNNGRGRGSPRAAYSPSRTIGVTNVSDLPPDLSGAQNRQFSPIWNVGGTAQATLHEPMRGISDGRGGFIRSGSNAPMYESHFLDDLSTDQDVDQMERRLAAALGLDQTSRVLTNSKPPENPRILSTGSMGIKRKYLYLETNSIWQDTNWTQDVPTDRKSTFHLGLAQIRRIAV